MSTVTDSLAPQEPSTLTVLTGLPGSGKSRLLIERVNASREAGRPTHTFMCRESRHVMATRAIWRYRRIPSRQEGVTCDLDHLVRNEEAVALLRELVPGTLAAFEEAQHFRITMVDEWIAAAERGVNVIVCTPSEEQLERFRARQIPIVALSVVCQRCNDAPAVKYLAFPHEHRTEALCRSCYDQRVSEARTDIAARLRAGEPSPGNKHIYQPVDLPQTRGWKVSRKDSDRRFAIMESAIAADAPLHGGNTDPLTYLDVGCNTGYFCRRMQEYGFTTTGVDILESNIDIARMLDSYIAKGSGEYVLADAYQYLSGPHPATVTVTAALSVLQWVMIQGDVERSLKCMEWLFAKTSHVCFVEVGYATEEHYRDKLMPEIGREWVESAMRRLGGFREIQVFDRNEHGLMRDLFVGVK